MDYNFLLNAIKKQGYSVTGLSKEIGMSQVGLKQSIERKSLRVDTLEKIADKLEIPILEFFNDDGVKNCSIKKEVLDIKHLGFSLGGHVYLIGKIHDEFEFIAKSLIKYWNEQLKPNERKKISENYHADFKNRVKENPEKWTNNEIIVFCFVHYHYGFEFYRNQIALLERNFAMIIEKDDLLRYFYINKVMRENDMISNAMDAFAEIFSSYNDSLKNMIINVLSKFD